MATFELVDEATYRVEGEITREDVEKINNFKIRTCLIIQNTKGQSSEIIGSINTDNVYFSILGGLDYFEKNKYNNPEYIERTYTAPKGLTQILQYFETIEGEMNPEWSDVQKCMYAYNALAVDTEYVKDLDQDILTAGVTERSLNGILYNQLTCAGMALTFKEMMDRLGIKCYYQNQKGLHDFNVVELDGKLRGVDVTWDCDDRCSFANFGQDADFYNRIGHFVRKLPNGKGVRDIDDEETLFDLTTFTQQEISENYSVIEDAIAKRQKINNSFRSFDRDKKRSFLPVDKFRDGLEEEAVNFTKLNLLKQMGVFPEGLEGIIEASKGRYGFVLDYIKQGTAGRDNVLKEISEIIGVSGGLKISDGSILWTHQLQGEIIEEPLTVEQYKQITPVLLEDVTQYYTQYFADGASQIDEMIETLNMIDKMPPEVASKTSTLRAHLFTRIQLFSKGDEFFKKIGIPKEEIEAVSGKAKEYFEGSREQSESEISSQKKENDLDFLYAIIQNDVIDVMARGQEYTEEDFKKIINEVRENWKGSEFSDEEFRQLLDEVLDKTLEPAQIAEDTIEAGITRQEINGVVQEIRRTQTQDLQLARDK